VALNWNPFFWQFCQYFEAPISVTWYSYYCFSALAADRGRLAVNEAGGK